MAERASMIRHSSTDLRLLANVRLQHGTDGRWGYALPGRPFRTFRDKHNAVRSLKRVIRHATADELHNEPWTDQEIATLRALHGDRKAAQAALRRTALAIEAKCRHLGLVRRCIRWTEAERAALSTDKGVSLAALPGRSPVAVALARQRAGLGRQPWKAWSDREIRLLETPEGRELLGKTRSPKAVACKAQKTRRKAQAQERLIVAIESHLASFRAAWLRDDLRRIALASIASREFTADQAGEAVRAAYRETFNSCGSYSLDETIGEDGTTYLNRLTYEPDASFGGAT